MNTLRSIFRRTYQATMRRFRKIGFGGIGQVIAAAYDSLGFSSLADTFGAWYVSQTPTGNVIEDETPSRKDRTELATTGSVFDGTNYFEKTDIANAVLGSDNTSFTVRVRFAGNGSSANGDHVISTYDDSTFNEGYRVSLVSGFVKFEIQDSGGVKRSAESSITEANIQAGGIYDVVGVYDAVNDLVLVYVDAVYHGENAAPSFEAPTQNIIRVAAKSLDTTGKWYGNIYEAQIWNDQALTPAEIVKLYDKEISYFQDDKAPSVAWLLDGPTCVDLIGDNDLSPVADPAAYVGSEGGTWLNDQGWTDYENLIYPSEDFTAGSGWGPANGAVRNEDGSFTFPTTSSRIQNAQGPFYEIGTAYKIVAQFELQDAGKDIELLMFYGSWLGEAVTIDANGIATATITPTGTAGTNVGIRYSTGEVTVHPVSYWIYKEENAASYIETTGSSVAYAIRPKRWNADLDADGYAADDANSFGPCKRNREYRNGPAITLDGTMGAPTTFDASNRTTLSGFARIMQTDNAGVQSIFDQSTGSVGWGFRIDNIDATTARLEFFHYPAEGGAADVIGSASAIVTIGQAHDIGFSWNAATGDVAFFVDSGEFFGGGPASTGIRADTTANLSIGLPNDVATNGLHGHLWDARIFEGELTHDEFNWLRTQGEIGNEPANLARHWPVFEESGVVIRDIVANDVATFTNDPTWNFTANDSYFYGETVGYSSVPVFVDGVELTSPTSVNHDGIKSATLELDYVPLEFNGMQVLFTNGSISPYRIETTNSNNALRMFIRDSANVSQAYNLENLQVAGQLYQYRVVITEDADNPTTASSITVTDRITGAEIASLTGLDIAISSAASNTGTPQLGNYATGLQTFTGDLYRFRQWIEDTLVCSVDFPSFANAGSAGDFTESGGTLETKKIPLKPTGYDLNGYPANRPAGPYHNRTAAEVTETPVANSDSVNPIYYGAEFADSAAITIDHDFDTDWDGWTPSYVGNAGLLPIRSTTEAYNGTHSVRFIADFSSEAIISQTFNLSSAGTLQFRYFKNGNHYGAIEVRVNGVKVSDKSIQSTSSWSAGGTGPANTWNQTDEIALSAGTNAIEILIDTDSDNQSTDYVYMDNIQISYNAIGSSSIRLADDFNWHQSWSFVAKVKPDSVSGTKNLFHSTSANYGIKIIDDDIVVRLNGTDHTFSDVPLTVVESDVSIEFAGGDAAAITVTVDGTSQTITGPTIGTNTSVPWIGASNVPDNHYSGMLRGVVITNDGAAYYDSPLYKDSVDRKNVGDPNIAIETDITYISNAMETDLNPDIAESETRAVTTGDRKIISIGAR